MAAVLRKRRIIDTHWGESPTQRSIASFGRVSKAGAQRLAKKNVIATRVVSQDVPAGRDSKKRRIEDTPEPALVKPVAEQQPARKAQNSQSVEQQRQPLQESVKEQQQQKPTPGLVQSKQTLPKTKQAKLGPSKAGDARRIAPLKRSKDLLRGSPTQGARAILEAFVIGPNSSANDTQAAPAEPESESKPLSYIEPPNPSQDLTDLHTALLNALSLHYAHNGTAAPADLRTLAPCIEQIWTKRRIAIEDIQRVIGVQQWHHQQQTQTQQQSHQIGQHNLPILSLVSFNTSRICIEYDYPGSQPTHAQPLPTAATRAAFARNLLAFQDKPLPLAEITPFVSRATAVNARGARRLADLRAGSAANANQNGSTTQNGLAGLVLQEGDSSFAAQKDREEKELQPMQSTSSRATSLLARIRAKEDYVAANPAPSEEVRARRAALMRLEGVIPVLCSLVVGGRSTIATSSASSASATSSPSTMPTTSITASNGTSQASADLAASLGLGGSKTPAASKVKSFTMAAVVQHLQNSLKHPISRSEAQRCVEVLAEEVAPNWVSVRKVGAIASVSLRGVVGRGEWVGRVEELVGQC